MKRIVVDYGIRGMKYYYPYDANGTSDPIDPSITFDHQLNQAREMIKFNAGRPQAIYVEEQRTYWEFDRTIGIDI